MIYTDNAYVEILSNDVANMALVEKLDGHKLSVTIRQTDKK